MLTYSFQDMNDHRGISQYKIKQVDIDGKAKFSEVRAVRGEEQNTKMIIYPNPSRDGNFNIVFEDRSGTRDVALLDITGRVVRQWLNVTGNTIQADNIRPGIYSVRVFIRETGFESFEKLIVSR
jgi:hypothetical protein